MFRSLFRFSKPVHRVPIQSRPSPVLNHDLVKVQAKADIVLDIPPQTLIAAVDCTYDFEPMLRPISPDCKQLDMRGLSCGFDETTVSGLTHLWIDFVRPSMRVPVGLNLFIDQGLGPDISRRLWQLKYSGCNLFLNKDQFEAYDQLDLPEHHTFSTSPQEHGCDTIEAFGHQLYVTKHTPKKVGNIKE